MQKQKLEILIVDNDKKVTQILQIAFRKLGGGKLHFNTTFVSNSVKMMKYINSDIFIINFQQPKTNDRNSLSGIELIIALRYLLTFSN